MIAWTKVNADGVPPAGPAMIHANRLPPDVTLPGRVPPSHRVAYRIAADTLEGGSGCGILR
jgi:hypothetical protein